MFLIVPQSFQSCKAEFSRSPNSINFSLLTSDKFSKLQKYYKIWNSNFKLKPYQYIFSSRNSKDRKYKILYILGIKFYFKRRKNGDI